MKKVILTIGVLSLLVIIGYQNKKYKELNDKHKQLEVLVEEDTSALDFGELETLVLSLEEELKNCKNK